MPEKEDFVLTLAGISKRFGGLVAVNELDMQIRRGHVHGLIGPNGAGKSTAFDLISGLQKASSGAIRLENQDISSASVQDRVELGICRTFQTPRLFEKMCVLDVVKTGAHIHGKLGMLRSAFSFKAKRIEEDRIEHDAMTMLDIVGMTDEAQDIVANLSYGRRRLLEIARALATRPRVLLLDEVTSGLNPVETADVRDLILKLAGENLTIVVVEHDMPFVMGMCQEITVMNFGSRIAFGRPDQVSNDPAVIEAYLGTPHTQRLPYRKTRATLATHP